MCIHVVFLLGGPEAPKCLEAEPEKTSPELESKVQAKAHSCQAANGVAKGEEGTQPINRNLASGK